MALVELSFADHAKLSASGRSFSCDKCSEKIKQLRRCMEDREDFTPEDGSLWPIQIEQGGALFGFCPGKAFRDADAVSQFKLLTIAAESGTIELYDGGMSDQPEWWIDALSWFLPRYSHNQFVSRARMILGDGKKTPTQARRK